MPLKKETKQYSCGESYLLSFDGPGDQNSILGQIIPKIQKMVLDTSLLVSQHYEVWIKDKWSNPGKGVVAIEKGAFWSPLTTVANFTYFTMNTFSFFADHILRN